MAPITTTIPPATALELHGLITPTEHGIASRVLATKGFLKMSKYRNKLPQLSDRVFLTDGGLETTLIFHEGIELPFFASFDLFKNKTGIAQLRAYYECYIEMAKKAGVGFVLEGATWRANPDWAAKLGYDGWEMVSCTASPVGAHEYYFYFKRPYVG